VSSPAHSCSPSRNRTPIGLPALSCSAGRNCGLCIGIVDRPATTVISIPFPYAPLLFSRYSGPFIRQRTRIHSISSNNLRQFLAICGPQVKQFADLKLTRNSPGLACPAVSVAALSARMRSDSMSPRSALLGHKTVVHSHGMSRPARRHGSAASAESTACSLRRPACSSATMARGTGRKPAGRGSGTEG
jgi:hypothetical protein